MKTMLWKDIVGRAAVALGALAVMPMIQAGCRADDTNDEPPGATARGVYALDASEGEIALISFIDGTRYWVWKNTPACPASGDTNTCGEWGTYAVTGDQLTLTDDRTKASRSLPFQQSTAVKLPALTPANMSVGILDGLVGGGGSLVETQKSISGEVSIGGRSMRLLTNPVELLTRCEAREAGSGAIPGAPSPQENFERGVFRSGQFAPGGTYDPRTAAQGNLYRSATATSHHYALISDRLPAGTTWEEANAALQRFNGPTGPAVRGEGDDPNSTKGWVVDPVFNLPIGCVTFERGNGWARNTTQWNHPFIGTITRYVVDGGNCTFRILTVGEGQGGGIVNPPTTTGQGVTAGRHIANAMGGPSIFRDLDQKLIQSVRPARAGGGC
ncbi:hypothetical protein [Pendulispora albinea]|uniref:Uncharacterized protein n=1 Tax=Pendulispora albinea TaxID=2741071 RepID=A0ABZ2LVU5_9BACT